MVNVDHTNPRNRLLLELRNHLAGRRVRIDLIVDSALHGTVQECRITFNKVDPKHP